jgi:hypothetical protein
MKRMWLPLLALVLLAVAAVAVGCSDDKTVDTDKAKAQATKAAEQVKQQTRDAWASVRTDGDRLADEVQTRKDPEAKKQLLDKCRDTVERMRKDDQPNADRVNKLCDRIRDADPNDSGTWNQIKDQIKELNAQFGA